MVVKLSGRIDVLVTIPSELGISVQRIVQLLCSERNKITNYKGSKLGNENMANPNT